MAKLQNDDFTVYAREGSVWIKCDDCRTRKNLGAAVYPTAIRAWYKTHVKAGCDWGDR